MLLSIVLLFVTQLIISGVLLYGLWRGRESSAFDCLAKLLYSL
jgi:hypothetical protein